MSAADSGRRKFLAAGVAIAGLMVAPGVLLFAQASKPGGAAAGERRWGLLIDTTRCTEGCDVCVAACVRENRLGGTGRETDSRWIRKIDLVDPRSGKTRSLPMMCQHCAHPPCVDVCPTGASFKRADGIVLVDRHICIGCRYCMMACPYKGRSFVHEALSDQNPDVPRGKGTVEACTFCVHRVDRGGRPACVEACAAADFNALLFGDLNDPGSEISRRMTEVATAQVRADLGLDTGVRYQGL